MNSTNNPTSVAPLRPLAKLVGTWELEHCDLNTRESRVRHHILRHEKRRIMVGRSVACDSVRRLNGFRGVGHSSYPRAVHAKNCSRIMWCLTRMALT